MRKKLRKHKNKRVCATGIVDSVVIKKNDAPCACLINVRRKDSDEILTRHVWVQGNWIQTEKIGKGDKIQFYGLIREYRKFSMLRGEPVSDYNFTQIRNVRKINEPSNH